MRPLALLLLLATLPACDSTGVDGEVPNDGLPSGTIRVDPKQTYLRTFGDDAVDAPAVSLEGLGVEPGETACFETAGDYTVVNDIRASDRRDVLVSAVFASEVGLYPTTIRTVNRVIHAIEAGTDVVTPDAYGDGRKTDIPQDFAADGCVRVPAEAEYVYFSAVDDFFADNEDLREGGLPLRVRVTPQ